MRAGLAEIQSNLNLTLRPVEHIDETQSNRGPHHSKHKGRAQLIIQTTRVQLQNSDYIMANRSSPIIVLFGYDSSTFTLKVRLALKIKQIPYTFVKVPTMMPRPLLRDNFNLTYRKIPVLAMGRELYVDLCVERALEPTWPGVASTRFCLET